MCTVDEDILLCVFLIKDELQNLVDKGVYRDIIRHSITTPACNLNMLDAILL
jgi:hypothetical protein